MQTIYNIYNSHFSADTTIKILKKENLNTKTFKHKIKQGGHLHEKKMTLSIGFAPYFCRRYILYVLSNSCS